MIITDLLEINAAKYPDDIALTELDYTNNTKSIITWKLFNEKSNRLANYLMSKGIGKDDKVALIAANRLEWLPIYFGILKTGAWVVPINYRSDSEELKYCLELAEVSAVIYGDEMYDRIENIASSLVNVRIFARIGDNISEGLSNENPNVSVTGEDYSAIYFSSGTTGYPKAILHTHSSLFSACITEHAHHGQTKDDVFLCIPPLYHTGATMHWFGSLLTAGKAVILRGLDPKWIINAVSEERATIVWLMIPWAQGILDSIDRGDIKLEDYHLEQWRLMHIGAQPIPPSLINRWKSRFPLHLYDTNYGLSESMGPGCVHLGIENIHKAGAIGKAGYRWETKIIDDNGIAVAKGEKGELCVKGPGVMSCYYRDKSATDAVLKDGWILTGDVAVEDSDGFITLVDRLKDVIVMGGENIYPVQIENFIMCHDSVKDAAVIGAYDRNRGEIPIAIIELKEGFSCDESEMNEFCLGLPRYKRPKKIIFNKVPRNNTCKIDKPKLRRLYCGGSVVAAQVEL